MGMNWKCGDEKGVGMIRWCLDEVGAESEKGGSKDSVKMQLQAIENLSPSFAVVVVMDGKRCS